MDDRTRYWKRRALLAELNCKCPYCGRMWDGRVAGYMGDSTCDDCRPLSKDERWEVPYDHHFLDKLMEEE